MDEIIWSPGLTLEDMEKKVILKAFKFYGGNKERTAKGLGVSTKTLYTKLESYESQKKAVVDAAKGPVFGELDVNTQRWGHKPKQRDLQEKQGTVLPERRDDSQQERDRQADLALHQGLAAGKGSGKPKAPVQDERQSAQDGLRSTGGQRMEPTAQLPKKSVMPMSKR